MVNRTEYNGWFYELDGFYDDAQSMRVVFLPKEDRDAGFIHTFNVSPRMSDEGDGYMDSEGFDRMCCEFIDNLKLEGLVSV